MAYSNKLALLFLALRASATYAATSEPPAIPSGTVSGGNSSQATGSAMGAAPSGAMGGGTGGSGSTSAIYLVGAYTVDNQTLSNSSSTVSSTTADQNAVLITGGGNLTLADFTISKASGDTSSADNSNFYGLNAAVCAQNASTLYISDSSVSSDSQGSNGIYSTGSGSVIYVSNVNISTSSDSSRGLDSTQGGTIIANNVRISTKGAHCGGLANDRGAGIILVSGAYIETTGQGSPGIYCTGNITGSNIYSTSSNSQGIVIEGYNNVTITDSYLTGRNQAAIMLYQSTSGDAKDGDAIFTMTRGSLTIDISSSSSTTTNTTGSSNGTSSASGPTSSASGAIIYVTNQNAYVNLYDNATLSSTSNILAKCSADSWGVTNSNGGTLTLLANYISTLSGSILADSISSISVSLVNSTSYSGFVPSSTGKIGLSIDASSTWTLTGNAFLYNFTNLDTSMTNIKDNGFYIYYNSSSDANSWLAGKSYSLSSGGMVKPWTSAETSNTTYITGSTTNSTGTTGTSTGMATSIATITSLGVNNVMSSYLVCMIVAMMSLMMSSI